MSVFDSAASQYPAGAFFDDDAPWNDDELYDIGLDEEIELEESENR